MTTNISCSVALAPRSVSKDGGRRRLHSCTQGRGERMSPHRNDAVIAALPIHENRNCRNVRAELDGHGSAGADLVQAAPSRPSGASRQDLRRSEPTPGHQRNSARRPLDAADSRQHAVRRRRSGAATHRSPCRTSGSDRTDQAGSPPNSQTSSGSGQTPGTRTGKNALNETVTDCMKLWEPATHMSKADWQRTCRRVQGRLDQVSKQVLGR